MKRTLLQQDGVLVRQAAMAAGQQALMELQFYYTEREEFYEASKVAYAGVLAVGYYGALGGVGSSSPAEQNDTVPTSTAKLSDNREKSDDGACASASA